MIPKIRTIVVGAELGRSPDPVLAPAVEFASRLGAALHVVHGYMLNDPLLDAYARSGYLGDQALANFGRELQASLERDVRAVAGDRPVTSRTVAGSAAAALLQTADEVEADLIVVGGTHHHRFPQALLGSTCRAVLRRTSVPVFLMRRDVPPLADRVLAPTDLSPASESAFGWGVAASMAESRRVEVRSLLVINRSLMLLPLEQRLVQRVAEEELEEFTKRVAVPVGAVEQVTRTGDPAEEILAEAREWEADLVVMATQGRRGMERLLIGSVAESVLRDAPCNVLLVPPDTT